MISNTISSTEARHLILEHTGVAYSRESFRRLFALMIEAQDAEAGREGVSGRILSSSMPKWINYIEMRKEWKSNHPYRLEDVENESVQSV